MKSTLGLLLAGLSLSLVASDAYAVFIDLDPGTGSFVSTGPGTGRSVYLTSNEEISVTSIGIYGDLVATSFDVLIYAASGVADAPGPILASSTSVTGGAGLGWYDIEVDATLASGVDYLVSWRPSDGTNTWANALEYYLWGNSPFDDVNLGAVTIRDGREGFDAMDFENTVAPHLRIGRMEVAEPSSLALIGAALLGLLVMRRRKH